MSSAVEMTALKVDAAEKQQPQAKAVPRAFDKANWLSQWTFWWLNSLLTLGYKRPLQTADVPSLPLAESAQLVADRFEDILRKAYANHQPGSKADAQSTGKTAPSTAAGGTDIPSLSVSIWRLVGPSYCGALAYAFTSEVLAFAGPILVQYITDFLDDETEPAWRGWLYVALLFVLPTIASICRNAYFLNSWRVAVRLRAGILTAVFRKSLKLSPAARRLVSDGEILTLMSADAQKLSEIWPVLYVLFTAPLSILACFVLLWLQVQESTLAGAAVIAVLMPCNIWLGKTSGGYRRFEAAQTDLRMKYVKEAVSNMKVIKQYGWSSSFEERITAVRTEEIRIRKKAAYLEAVSNSILILTPVLISLVTFLTFAGTGGVLTSTNVFTSLALFNVMRFQLSQFPLVLTALFEAKVSLTRIRRLLLREEIDPSARDYAEEPLPAAGQPVARIAHSTFNWDISEEGSAAQNTQAQAQAKTVAVAAPKGTAATGAKNVGTDSNFRLSDIDLTVPRGSFVAVVGAVGSGKSSLLQALLGEVKRISGPPVFMRGRVALVPQSAWILNMSLEKNILFGIEKDEAVYQRVIDLCCLRSDLAQLPGGDQTEIGDKGVNLSGGQKQRTAIARAVYSVLLGHSDVLLIDDPLSAVDAHVSKSLFDNVLSRDGVLGQMGVTIVLAMNQLHFLPKTDHVVVMREGVIAQQGKFSQLMQQGDGELAQLMGSYGFQHDEEEKKQDEQEATAPSPDATTAAPASPNPAAVAAQNAEIGSSAPAVNATAVVATAASTAAATAKATKAGQTTQSELRMEGSVAWKVYAAYIRASGGWGIAGFIIFLFCIHQVGRVYADFWLADWASHFGERTLAFWQGIFALFGGVVTVASLARSLTFADKGLDGSFTLHQDMLHSIFRSPSSFFDTTPTGRIINRFSSDIDKLDHMLPRILEGFGGCVFFVLGTLVAVCVVYPYFFAPLIGIIAVYYYVQRYYVSSSRELQRLDNISKSPVFSHFGESLVGASSIRAFHSGERTHRQNENLVDANHRNVLAYQAALCWLGVRVELISTLLMTISGIFAVSSRGSIDSALVGLSIVYSITITSFLNFAVRLSSVVESMMSSVERLEEYSVLPAEAPHYLPDVDPQPSWPAKGSINFSNCVLRYRPELDVVLRGISAQINGGEKIGIIGRTGSGKSSLMVALFRLVELSSGKIEIDGVDIGKIGLEALRTKITLIPQDPVVFNGTVRYNLDPLGSETDDRIWRVLQLVNLEKKIKGMDGQLDFKLSEGESLSVGERQLLCVARALLRQTTILILDEATASVDIESDNLIQHVISTQFQRATVLAIAHRLSTIMDYDRILVMDGGNVAEFGVPHELMQNPNSALLSLVDATGPASAAHLKRIAALTLKNKQLGRPRTSGLSELAEEAPLEFDQAPETSCVRFHDVDAQEN